MLTNTHHQVAIIGAGPIGLEVAWALKNAGVDYIHFDKNQIASTIDWFPSGAHFFSSTDRIAICGVPVQTVNQAKATREEYLAYLRTVALTFDLRVRTYEEVTGITRRDGKFLLQTRRSNALGATASAGSAESAVSPAQDTADSEDSAGRATQTWTADRIVIATGDMASPRRLNIPGEDLPHVSHYFRDPHPYFRKKLLIVGGKNSAVEAALRCYHMGADVTLSYRGDKFSERSVKYWLLPELMGRIKRGEIRCHYNTAPAEITPTHVLLRPLSPGERAGVRASGDERDAASPITVGADFVLLLTGYIADQRLLTMAGVELRGESQTPVVNESTMETNIPGVYVAGTAVAGTQQSYRLFIENCHIHATRIAAALTGHAAPPPPTPIALPES